MEIISCHKGQHIWYVPAHGKSQFGIVKSINKAMKGHAFVVFNCGSEWEHYEDYTGVNTKIEDLIPADVIIVKARLTKDDVSRVLINDKTLDIMYETPMTDKLQRLLGDKSEGYWYSLVNDDPSDSTKVKLCMLNEASLEKW